MERAGGRLEGTYLQEVNNQNTDATVVFTLSVVSSENLTTVGCSGAKLKRHLAFVLKIRI